MGTQNWYLAYVLSNLEIRDAFSDISNVVSIVPFNDERLIEIKEASSASKKLLGGFRNEYGHTVKPAALIFHKDAPSTVKNVRAMVDFRNCVNNG